MINIYSIRIGNLVEMDGRILPICSIHSDETLRLKDGFRSIGCFSARQMNDVPLTGSILKKVGFENLQTEYCESFQLGPCLIEFTPDCHVIVHIMLENDNKHVFFDSIKSISHLQNLFFDTTGKELKYSA